MKDFLTYLISLIVDHPEKIAVEENILGENFYQYKITTHQDDMGKVIGKGGKIIQSLRNLAKILAIKENKQIRIELA